MRSTVLVLAAGLMLTAPLVGAADLVRNRSELPDLVLGKEEGNNFAVSQKDIEMESGKSCRLALTAKGTREYKFFAPGLFRNTWMVAEREFDTCVDAVNDARRVLGR